MGEVVGLQVSRYTPKWPAANGLAEGFSIALPAASWWAMHPAAPIPSIEVAGTKMTIEEVFIAASNLPGRPTAGDRAHLESMRAVGAMARGFVETYDLAAGSMAIGIRRLLVEQARAAVAEAPEAGK